MEKPRTRIKIPAKPLLLAFFLACAILGLLLVFAHGFDITKKFIDVAPYLAILPFAAAYVGFLPIETFGGKTSERFLFDIRPNYTKTLKIHMALEALFLLASIILVSLYATGNLSGLGPAWGVFFVSIGFFPGQVIFQAHLFGERWFDEAEHNKKTIAIFAIALVIALAGYAVGTLLSFILSTGWSLFYLASPMALVILTCIDLD